MKYKIVILGDGGTGKSCLTIQFCYQFFVPDYDPTVENLYQKRMNCDGHLLVLEILDTAGQEQYSALQDQYIRMGDGFLVVYSIIQRRSFELLEDFRVSILRVKETDSFPMVLVGNKCDMESLREVSFFEAQELAKKFGCPLIETSAKTRTRVDETFFEIVREIQKFEQANQQRQDAADNRRTHQKRRRNRRRCIVL